MLLYFLYCEYNANPIYNRNIYGFFIQSYYRLCQLKYLYLYYFLVMPLKQNCLLYHNFFIQFQLTIYIIEECNIDKKSYSKGLSPFILFFFGLLAGVYLLNMLKPLLLKKRGLGLFNILFVLYESEEKTRKFPNWYV
jgi:hypothetical protein